MLTAEKVEFNTAEQGVSLILNKDVTSRGYEFKNAIYLFVLIYPAKDWVTLKTGSKESSL